MRFTSTTLMLTILLSSFALSSIHAVPVVVRPQHMSSRRDPIVTNDTRDYFQKCFDTCRAEAKAKFQNCMSANKDFEDSITETICGSTRRNDIQMCGTRCQ
ncbi:hypothetical protein BGZ51_004389 [Haplosporangium sp. Z 767]|nr:hypothetical protein BGZ51_004389 [Haplosporangium sp. Z 767]KAF9190417.1 hypothetical protein BGZ50_000225 [Haplosporangium sp. Z 11]